nr:MAG TPA: Peptidoglycan endopeptidase [Caudoviricetes sp.]
MIDEVFRKNKTTQKIADAEERFLKISPLPDGSKVVDTRSSRLTYVADPMDDKDAINKSWATKYFKDEKDAVTKLGESATAKSAELDTKLVKFNSDKASIEQTGEELKVLSAETKSRVEETKAKLESALAQLEQAKTKIDNFNTDYAKAKELKGDIEGKAVEVKANLDSVRSVLADVTSKSTDILLTYSNAKQDLTNLGNATKLDIGDVATRTKQEIATTKASIDTKANEALNQASTALTDIRGIIADFRGKQTELNALKASLETLKSSLESLNKSGLINDTQAGIAQTYSSNKINNLLQGVLRESDASESNANGKLVRRNAQGNIYATNVYLNATTKAEVSDIKNSLATDKWRFIVRDTGEGLLRSMSIKDFISSQEVDAYKKSESDNRYLAKSEAYGKTESDNRYLAKSDGEQLYRKIGDSYSNTQTDNLFVKQSSVSENSEYEKIVKRTQTGGINVGAISSSISQTEIGKDIFTMGASADYSFGIFSGNTLCKVKPNEIKRYLNTYYTNSVDMNNALSYKVNTTDKDKPYGYAGLDNKGKIKPSAVPYTENVTALSDTLEINPSLGKNFIITLNNTTGTFNFFSVYLGIGQGGVIVVKGANKITGWGATIKWREVPTDLGETEVFSYFIANTNEVYMGRA